jgi:hypothetical protein
MLEGVESEVSQPRRLRMVVDSEDAALITKFIRQWIAQQLHLAPTFLLLQMKISKSRRLRQAGWRIKTSCSDFRISDSEEGTIDEHGYTQINSK